MGRLRKYNVNVGDVFGQWTVTDDAVYHKEWRRIVALCQCSCGTEKLISTPSLVLGTSTRCMSCKSKSMVKENHGSWTGYEKIPGRLLTKVKNEAKRRGIEYSVTPKHLWEIYQQQRGLCALSGLPLHFGRVREVWGFTASVDRIDSTRGYVVGNIQWVHKDVNIMKNSYTQKYFTSLCNLISKKFPYDGSSESVLQKSEREHQLGRSIERKSSRCKKSHS